MSGSNGLPKGWAEATLGDVLRIIRGVSYKKEQASSAPRASFVPLLRATNIGMELDFDDLVYVPTSCVDQEQMLVAGDIVVASSSGSKTVVGKASRLTADWHGSFGAFCMGLRVVPPVDSQYICYFMQTHEYRHQISELASGSNINNLRRDHIESFPFRLAPLPEQHRIVAKIEELFSHLDAAVASLQRAKANLKRYRASVLKSAVEGRLTEDWRKEHPQAEDGRMLLDRILRERREKWERDQLAKFKEKGEEPPKNWQSKYVEPAREAGLHNLPVSWVWASALEICERVENGNTPPSDEMTSGSGDVPFIKVYNITRDGRLDFTIKPTFVSKKTHEERLGRSRVLPNDVLINIVGPPLGKVALVPEAYPEWNMNQAIVLFRTSSGVLSRYLLLCLMSDEVLRWITRTAKATAGQFNISVANSRLLPIPLPPLAEQQQIVALVEERLSQINAAEKTIDTELVRSKRLRQSILKRAFEGKLVPQDPSDEPASVLLERIQLDRTKASRDGKRPTRPRRARRSP